ncbi:MAG: LemA family protein [Crocinitomicaceae bacterium]|nr:LemA family protein [Crocinitomicaceae bacterium]
MKKSYLIIGGIALLIIIAIGSYASTYNKAVGLQEEVDAQWGNVNNTYQRRLDLIPNLVKVVKSAADKEKEIFESVTRARSGLPSTKELESLKNDIKNAKDPAALQKLEQQLQANEKAAQTFLNVAVEAYPNLKSIEGFKGLQVQLEGTENRINKARDDYNGSVKNYNTHIRGFFASMILNKEEFKKKTAFKAQAGAENAVDIDM